MSRYLVVNRETHLVICSFRNKVLADQMAKTSPLLVVRQSFV